jgi:hypothetical protein
MTTKQHNRLYRPKINDKTFNSVGRYCRFINQFTDKNDWGYQKRHRWSWTEMEEFLEEGSTSHTLKNTYAYTLTFIKGHYFGHGKNKQKIDSIDDIFLIDKNSPEFPQLLDTWTQKGQLSFKRQRHLCLEHHLLAAQQKNKKGYLFYTSSPDKEYNLICCDIDKIESNEAYHAVVDYLSSLFPGSYYERSTNGTGLHFYILVQFDTNRMLFSEGNEGVFRNVLYALLSEALGSVVNAHFKVQFDAVKATCPIYDINKKFLKYGDLVKLPAPVSYSQFEALYSASFFSEQYLLFIINYLHDLSCRYIFGVYSRVSIESSLVLLLKEHPVRSNPKDFIPKLKKENKEVPTTIFLPTTTITNGGTKCLQGQNRGYSRAYSSMDIMNEGDSRRRESLYIKKFVGDYYCQYGQFPGVELVEAEYRKEMNYHKIGDYREKRFRKYYDHTIQTFDKDKASDRSGPYKIGMYDALIQKTDEELTQWVNKNTSYKRNIYRQDVDIALEYLLMCSNNSMNQARETLIRKYACQEGVSVERAKIQLQNTAPRKGLEKFFDYVSVNQTIEGKKINKCDRKKASALFCLVVELGLCECIDDSYDRGKARKFRVSDTVRQVRESWNMKKNLNGDNIGGAKNTMRIYSDISADKKVS